MKKNRELIKIAASKWGRGWNLLSSEQQEAHICKELVWAMYRIAVYMTGEEFKNEFLEQMQSLKETNDESHHDHD